ncbi:hypothetical protein CDAR_385241 [Caerostris darwini]|uniref:Uncharacterized protein n=1 Tax=Caerostris darwini TaxID=1538125 RepID=A0AAV4UJW5_9ARAC|nr:hypothetical protein CDAR_385241 [Caerostris darwini]
MIHNHNLLTVHQALKPIYINITLPTPNPYHPETIIRTSDDIPPPILSPATHSRRSKQQGFHDFSAHVLHVANRCLLRGHIPVEPNITVCTHVFC